MNLDGIPVIIKYGNGNKILAVLKEGESLNTHYGTVNYDDVTKLPIEIATSTKELIRIYEPTYSEFVLHMKRGAQIIYPKDVASILLEGNVWQGSKVLEFGSGSGALTLALSLTVGDKGSLYSIDRNKDNQRRALKTIKRYMAAKFDLSKNVFFIHKDIDDLTPEDIPEDLTHIITDVPEPWKILDKIKIQTPIRWISYLPNITQVQSLNEKLVKFRLDNITTKEIIEREWKVDGNVVRPVQNITGHTGFLIFADFF